MGTAPGSEVQDDLIAALEASDDPGSGDGDEQDVTTTAESDESTDKKEDTEEQDKTDEAKADAATPTDSAVEENRELRQILRQQRRELQILQGKLSRLERKSVAKTKVAEAEAEDELFGSPAAKDKTDTTEDDAEKLSPIEAAQIELSSVARNKADILGTLLETMELNPKYSDVKDVCSQANFDDIFEAVGNAVAEREGIDASLAALQAELAVWKLPNPYKYMYDLIKKHHPKYATRQEQKKDAADEKTAVKAKEAAKAPSTVADKSGKSVSAGAWTAARIDELPEEELDTVPKDIYEKYMRGELD